MLILCTALDREKLHRIFDYLRVFNYRHKQEVDKFVGLPKQAPKANQDDDYQRDLRQIYEKYGIKPEAMNRKNKSSKE